MPREQCLYQHHDPLRSLGFLQTWQEVLHMKDHSQYLLGAWMLPSGAQGEKPTPISGLGEGLSAHRLGQMGLVQGDESAP